MAHFCEQVMRVLSSNGVPLARERIILTQETTKDEV